MSTRLRIIHVPNGGYYYNGAQVKAHFIKSWLRDHPGLERPAFTGKQIVQALHGLSNARCLIVREPRRVRKSKSLYKTTCIQLGIGQDIDGHARNVLRAREAVGRLRRTAEQGNAGLRPSPLFRRIDARDLDAALRPAAPPPLLTLDPETTFNPTDF